MFLMHWLLDLKMYEKSQRKNMNAIFEEKVSTRRITVNESTAVFKKYFPFFLLAFADFLLSQTLFE